MKLKAQVVSQARRLVAQVMSYDVSSVTRIVLHNISLVAEFIPQDIYKFSDKNYFLLQKFSKSFVCDLKVNLKKKLYFKTI